MKFFGLLLSPPYTINCRHTSLIVRGFSNVSVMLALHSLPCIFNHFNDTHFPKKNSISYYDLASACRMLIFLSPKHRRILNHPDRRNETIHALILESICNEKRARNMNAIPMQVIYKCRHASFEWRIHSSSSTFRVYHWHLIHWE